MHDLVADLLDVARIETGTLPVTPEPAEVAVLVDRARSTFTSAGGRNNLAIDIPPDLPLVMADRRRIVQVVGNLLSNAAARITGFRAFHLTLPPVSSGLPGQSLLQVPYPLLRHLYHPVRRIRAKTWKGGVGQAERTGSGGEGRLRKKG